MTTQELTTQHWSKASPGYPERYESVDNLALHWALYAAAHFAAYKNHLERFPEVHEHFAEFAESEASKRWLAPFLAAFTACASLKGCTFEDIKGCIEDGSLHVYFVWDVIKAAGIDPFSIAPAS